MNWVFKKTEGRLTDLPPIMIILGGLLVTLLMLIMPAGLYAQNGNIEGIVKDRQTGETLPGVNVIVKGTSFGSATDADGHYAIHDIRPGTYNLEFRYIGYETVLLTGISVKSGQTTTRNVAIGQKVLTSEQDVVVIGEKPIFDVEKSNSSVTVNKSVIDAAPVQKVQDVVSMQAGVTQDPSGIYIKGGRSYETGYIVDGVSAQDPLSGTGFGLDVGANALSSVEVITGGVGAEYGDVTSGVVNVKTRDGGDTYSGSLTHKRDNFGSKTGRYSNFFSDLYDVNIGGPSVIFEKILPALGIDIPGKVTFFLSGQANVQDGYTRYAATKLHSSLIKSDFWTPRENNQWSGMAKMTYHIKPTMTLQASYQRSLTINQNTNMLRITGNDVQFQPGYQFFFQNNLDNANTYAHESILSYIKWSHTLNGSTFYNIQLSRLFTRLRADVNGRYWRPDSVNGEFDASSIVTYPVTEFPTGNDFQYVLPGPGLSNNGGLSSLWHDHFAEEITLKSTLTKYFAEKQDRLDAGMEFKFQDYQWIDIQRPWIGAPIRINDSLTSQSSRLGGSSDIWRVKPKRGAFYANDQIRYRGLIANIGARLEYWYPGHYVDAYINDPRSPIPDAIRKSYKKNTHKLFGGRFKMWLLPKLNVSFPVRENQVMFFNYTHSARVPHPSYIYAGLNPYYQDRSFLSQLGNPDLNPEVDISYEIGLRNQLSQNDALNISAFWHDKYDFITTQSIIIPDATGQETQRAFRINGDYARVRGIEVTYIKRYQDWFLGNVSASYSKAEGLSSSSNEALQNILVGGQNVGNNIETPLAWDRPWDVKWQFIFTYDRRNNPLFGIPPMNHMKLFLSGYWRSGLRYSPYIFKGFSTNPITGRNDWRPIYEMDPDPAKRFSKVGPFWFNIDLNFQKWFTLSKSTRLSFFMEITNLLNSKNAAIINPVTGKGYRSDYPPTQQELIQLRDNRAYDVPSGVRDPRYLDPRDNNTPTYLNPADYLPQRHFVFGASFNF